MKKRARGRKPKASQQPPHSPDATRAMMERSMADLTAELQQHDFQSEADLRAFLEKRLQGPLDGPRIRAGDTPARQAQQLVYDAWEADGRHERIALAERALRLDADCADAYSLLAETKATSAAEASALYDAAVRAGERTLGEAVFVEDAGYFWGLHPTRPYMRARAGLAQSLWEIGRHADAIGHARDMLRLNPSDNQGMRYILLDWLLEANEDEEAGRLLEQFDDEISAAWLYGRALLLFRRGGKTAWSDAALRNAIAENTHVPAYLLGKKRIPKKLPDYISPGEANEAQAYAAVAGAYWRATAGALAWLAE